MKHYIVSIEEKTGEARFNTQFLTTSYEQGIDDIINIILSNWRCENEKYNEDDRGYWHGEILVCLDKYEEISTQECNILKKFIPEL